VLILAWIDAPFSARSSLLEKYKVEVLPNYRLVMYENYCVLPYFAQLSPEEAAQLLPTLDTALAP
jgi:hypothetical protein